MLRGWRNMTPALGLLALAAWLPIIGVTGQPAGAGGDAVRAATAVRAQAPDPAAYPWLKPGQAVWYAGTRQKLVALTFDDGLDPTVTPPLLAALARHQAHATFFLAGDQVQRDPALVRSLVTQGHEVGSHGFGPGPLPGLGRAAIAADLHRAEAAIAAVTGQRPHLFRPPGGRVSQNVVAAASGLGYRTVFWSSLLPVQAWAGGQHPAVAVSPGDILRVVADPGDSRAAVAVEALLSDLARQGYRCVTVSELLQAG